MEAKKVVICDEKWYEKNGPLTKVYFDELVKVDYKADFSYVILNEISKRYNDTICIIGKGYKEELDKVDSIIKFTHNNHNYNVIYNNDDEFDFSSIGNDAVICVRSRMFNNSPSFRVFSRVIDLQKYFLSAAMGSSKHYIYILNSNGAFKKVETNEDKRIKNVRRKKPRKEIVKSKPKDSIPANQINKKPKIVIVCDVQGWAWWIKSHYIKKYLEPYYDIDVISVIDGKKKSIDFKKYDIYFTYGYTYVSRITRADYSRRVAGVTAHRPIDVLEAKLSKVKWVHANSLLLYNEISEIFPNTFYVPNGVDTDLFYPQSDIVKNGNITFGHVGKMSPKKGQKEYIEPAINKAGVKYFSHYNNYKDKVAHTDMPKIHHNYDVFICASKEDGTPCPALEAAACGRPIISNRIGNMPELIENYKTGILLDSKKVDDYVDAIKWCNDNPEKVREMSINIRRKIETEWTWNLMARNYLYLFDKILGIDRGLSYYENPAFYHGIE